MTNAEFLSKLNAMFAEYPMLAKSKVKTLNELVYVLRMQEEDYQINTEDVNRQNGFGCIPSVKEAFIPVRFLKQKIVSIEFDEEIYNEIGINLLLVKVK